MKNLFGIIVLGIVGILLFIGLSVGGWMLGLYNSLVTSNSHVDTAFAAIQSQYQRRFDLIPNVAEATKAFLQQEQTVFGDIAEARTKYTGSASGSNEQMQAMGQYDSALSRLMVIVENYPQLKSDMTVQALVDELAGTENAIAVARDRYNETVRGYNVQIRSFPANLIAGMYGFQSRSLFQAEAGAQDAVKINLTK